MDKCMYIIFFSRLFSFSFSPSLLLSHDNFAITSCILPNVCNIWVKCSWSNSMVFVVITPFVSLIVNDNNSTGCRSVANWNQQQNIYFFQNPKVDDIGKQTCQRYSQKNTNNIRQYRLLTKKKKKVSLPDHFPWLTLRTNQNLPVYPQRWAE